MQILLLTDDLDDNLLITSLFHKSIVTKHKVHVFEIVYFCQCMRKQDVPSKY